MIAVEGVGWINHDKVRELGQSLGDVKEPLSKERYALPWIV